jgi:hypothetical protein
MLAKCIAAMGLLLIPTAAQFVNALVQSLQNYVKKFIINKLFTLEKMDCNQVSCAMIACADFERTIVVPGECCPTCVPDCDLIECPDSP